MPTSLGLLATFFPAKDFFRQVKLNPNRTILELCLYILCTKSFST
jgi:hypothetical protein